MAPENGEGEAEEGAPDKRGIARVHIYGAGITGLTAAHELALRGFRVRVIDPAQESDETGQLEGAPAPLKHRMAVGGTARTQFFRTVRRSTGPIRENYEIFLEYPPDFEPGEGSGLVPATVLPTLRDFLNRSGFTRGEPPGYLHLNIFAEEDPERLRQLRRAAGALRRFLTEAGTSGPKLDPARVVVMDDEEARELRDIHPPPQPVDIAPGLWLEVLNLLPGEHVPCVFPPSFRHLLATLAGIPLLDARGQATGRSVLDNLVPASFHGIAGQGRRIRFLRGTPVPPRPTERFHEVRELAASGYLPSDTLQFTLRLWRYLCTSSERREAEYEGVSWWEYLEGLDSETGTRRYRYSETFKRDMRFVPQVLDTFDGVWGDARTLGNTLAQVYLDNLRPPLPSHRVLNGPTTLAWLRPWRRYLESSLGVEFRAGELVHLERDAEGTLQVYWKPRKAEKETEDREVRTRAPSRDFSDVVEPVDYYLVATDPATAERVTQGLPPIGVMQGLRGFTTTLRDNPRGAHPEQSRTPGVLPGHVPWDRFQTFTGVQYFFPSPVRLAEGYLSFLDTPWGLSALSGTQYWATPPTLERDGYASVLNVDLRIWFLQGAPKSPSSSSPHEIAGEVWEQLRQAAELHGKPLPQSAQAGFPLPDPEFTFEGTGYHLDRFIRFGVDPDTSYQHAFANEAPVFVPIVDDWDRRPGASPRDPLHPPPSPTTPGIGPATGVWQAPHGGYPVHFDKLVFAGPYLKTFTRTGSLEAANESARHAVNAILDHHLARPHASEDPRSAAGGAKAPGPTAFRMTPLGEYCRIWDPEQHELPALRSLRELDAKLFAAGKPHVWDMLHLEPLALPLLQHFDPQRGTESLLELLRKARVGLETLLKAAAPGMKWPSP